MHRTEASSAEKETYNSSGSRCLFALSNDGRVKVKKSKIDLKGLKANLNRRYTHNISNFSRNL